MDTNAYLKSMIATKLESANHPMVEGAGDASDAAEILGQHEEIRNVVMNMIPQIGHLIKSGVDMYRRMCEIRDDDDMPFDEKRKCIRNILENTKTLALPPVTLSNGYKFIIEFGDYEYAGRGASFCPSNNTVTLYIISTLAHKNIDPEDLCNMPVDRVIEIFKDIITNEWSTVWMDNYNEVSIPTAIMHELRHGLDSKKYPNITDPQNRFSTYHAHRDKTFDSSKSDIIRLATQRFNDAITNQGNVFEVFSDQSGAMDKIVDTLNNIGPEPFVKAASTKTRGILADLMTRITGDRAYASLDRDKMMAQMVSDEIANGNTPDQSEIAKRVPENLRTKHDQLMQIPILYKWIGYLSSYTEINARIAQYMPRFAMLRKSNDDKIGPEEFNDELSKAFNAIAVKNILRDDMKHILGNKDFNECNTTNRMANKSIIRRLYVALVAANSIEILPTDDCAERLRKMAEYMGDFTKKKLPNKQRQVVPPPMPKHPKDVYRGGYVRQG